MSRLVVATAADIACITANMRPDEIRQWLALTGAATYNADIAARTAIAAGGPAWALVDDAGRPIAVGGYHVERPGVASLWMMGTMAGWGAHWRGITRTCKRMVADLLAGGFHRVEVTSLATRECAHAWYRRIGLTLAEPAKAWFADGSDAVTFAAVRGAA